MARRKHIFGSLFYDAFSVSRPYSVDDRVTSDDNDDEWTRTNISALSGIRIRGLSVQTIMVQTARPVKMC
jgi:hypothetical protein